MSSEKVVLVNAFLKENTHTLELPMHNGLVIELQHYGVITPAGQNHFIDMNEPRINYFLQPWVENIIRSWEDLMLKFNVS